MLLEEKRENLKYDSERERQAFNAKQQLRERLRTPLPWNCAMILTLCGLGSESRLTESPNRRMTDRGKREEVAGPDYVRTQQPFQLLGRMLRDG